MNQEAPKPKPRGKNARFEYMRDHFRYSTMNSWNQAHAPARKIKLGYINIPKDADETAWNILQVDNYMEESGFSHPLNTWQEEWNHEYQWGTNGRSGGYIVMYHGARESSGYKSHCLACGQLNYATVLEQPADDDKEGQLRHYVLTHNFWRPQVYLGQDEVKELGLPEVDVLRIVGEIRQEHGSEKPSVTSHNKCGRCREGERVNFERTHMKITCWPGKPVFEELLNGKYTEVRDDMDLEHAFEVIYSFDVAVDRAIKNFIEYCQTHSVEDESYLVEKTRRIAVEAK